MTPGKPISHVIAGLIIGAATVLSVIGLFYAGKADQSISVFLPLIILFLGVIIFIALYGNSLKGQAGFGNLFSYGFKITALVILITIIFTVFFLLVSPDVKEKMLNIAKQKMQENKDATPDEIEKNVVSLRQAFWPLTIGRILLTNAIVGAIASLIGAGITKKTPINPPIN